MIPLEQLKLNIEIKPNETENVNFFIGIKKTRYAIAVIIKKIFNLKKILD